MRISWKKTCLECPLWTTRLGRSANWWTEFSSFFFIFIKLKDIQGFIEGWNEMQVFQRHLFFKGLWRYPRGRANPEPPALNGRLKNKRFGSKKKCYKITAITLTVPTLLTILRRRQENTNDHLSVDLQNVPSIEWYRMNVGSWRAVSNILDTKWRRAINNGFVE